MDKLRFQEGLPSEGEVEQFQKRLQELVAGGMEEADAAAKLFKEVEAAGHISTNAILACLFPKKKKTEKGE